MVSVLIYEDNTQLREGLHLLISGSEGFKVLAAFNNCDHVLEDLAFYQPHIILMDINMTGTDGIEGLKMIRKHNREVKVLMLTVFDDNEKIFEALKNGANGYVLKKTLPSKLLAYIHEAYYGGTPISSTIAARIFNLFGSQRVSHHPFDLTATEAEVLKLLVDGFSYKMIGEALHIPSNTIRACMKSIYEKMHAHHEAEALHKASRNNAF